MLFCMLLVYTQLYIKFSDTHSHPTAVYCQITFIFCPLQLLYHSRSYRWYWVRLLTYCSQKQQQSIVLLQSKSYIYTFNTPHRLCQSTGSCYFPLCIVFPFPALWELLFCIVFDIRCVHGRINVIFAYIISTKYLCKYWFNSFSYCKRWFLRKDFFFICSEKWYLFYCS